MTLYRISKGLLGQLARDEIAHATIEPITRRAPTGDNDELDHIRQVDLEKLVLQIYGEKKAEVDIREIVLDASFVEAIDETPTFKVTFYDPEWTLLNSGALEHAIDIHVAKRRWYRLDEVDVDDDQISLTFITRNAAYLMMHNDRRHVSRNKATRAEFVLMLVRAVKKTKIKFYCPELHVKQPIAKFKGEEITTSGSSGSRASAATVKGKILNEGDSLAVGSRSRLHQLNSKVSTRAKVGRTSSQGLADLQSAGTLPPNLVVQLGTNDTNVTTFTANIHSIINLPGVKRVLWVNISRPSLGGTTDNELNDALNSVASSSSKLSIIDWKHAVTSGRVHLGDKIHPATAKGYEYRAKLINNALGGTIARAATVSTDSGTARDAKRNHGLPDHGIKVQGHPIGPNDEQLGNLEDVLNVGEDMDASERDLIIAVATVTQESGAKRSATNGQFVGLFQQSSRYGWPATRDPKKDAPAFFAKEIPFRKSHATMQNGEIAQQVQGAIGGPINATYAHDVQQWVEEATHTVKEFLGGDSLSEHGGSGLPEHGGTEVYPKQYNFDSDPDKKGKNYLNAIYDLGDEVNWRAYWVRDVLHFSDEERLFRSRARARIVRGQNGVESVSFGWALHKKLNQMIVKVHMDKWFCPVGTVVVLGQFGVSGGDKPHEGGPARGRWLVNRIERNVFNDLATVTLTKPIRKKKEPAPEAGTRQVGDAAAVGGDTAQGTPKQIIDDVVLPLARRILRKPSLTAEAVEQANAAHSMNTTSGNRSDHKGPPAQAWAADCSNTTKGNYDKSAPTNEMDRLAKELADLFGLKWSGSGIVNGNDKDNQYRYQMLYRTDAGGGHWNHVHFGIKLLKPLAQNRTVDTPATGDPNRRNPTTGRTPTQDHKQSGNQRAWNDKSFRGPYPNADGVPAEQRVSKYGWYDSHHTIRGGPYIHYPA